MSANNNEGKLMRAVIFDLDGTLIDSLPDIAAAVNYLLAAKGLEALPASEIKVMIGDGARVLVNRAFAARGIAPVEADYAAFEAWYTQHADELTTVYPGMMETLAQLRDAGHKLGVCTNKPEAATRAILASLQLEPFFDAVIGGNSTPYRKPDPRHLEAVLAAMGAEQAVMIGDHHNDIEAARGLGLPSIYVAWGYGLGQTPYVANSAWELPALVANLPA